jgi:hypothetical protein
MIVTVGQKGVAAFIHRLSAFLSVVVVSYKTNSIKAQEKLLPSVVRAEKSPPHRGMRGGRIVFA